MNQRQDVFSLLKYRRRRVIHYVDLFFINDVVMWANKDRDMTIKKT